MFSLFQAAQIQQFKEAFQLIDHDKDGWVNESDLKEIFSSLGWSFRCVSPRSILKLFDRHFAVEANDGRVAQCTTGHT